MKNQAHQTKVPMILGLGKSGLSCAGYFDRIDQDYIFLDTRNIASGGSQLKDFSNCKEFYFGNLEHELLDRCLALIVSPGVPLTEPFVEFAISSGIEIYGDIEIFVRNSKKPIIAITGSNGKSTVTDLTEKLLRGAGVNAQKGGNIGLPVLDFLPKDDADLYVLELSSFQLDTTKSLKPRIAVLLNISEDHMDRYASFKDYKNSKLKVYNNACYKIFNQDDTKTTPKTIQREDYTFSSTEPSEKAINKMSFLSKKNNCSDKRNFELVVDGKPIMSTCEMKMAGTHNYLNALTCLSILDRLEINIDCGLVEILNDYSGLPHRFQRVSRKNGVEWINDSKATNVGSALSALNSVIKGTNKLILIAGGDSKESDLTPLTSAFEKQVNQLILMGKDAERLAALTDKVPVCFAKDMKQAVELANEIALEGDTILLSPACSSLDMFKNFEQRGEMFVDAIGRCA